MEYEQLSMDLSQYQAAKEEIKSNLGGIIKSFVRIGWLLTRIDASGAYRQDGYKSIAEFAKSEYNMTASGVSRFMDVYQKYSIEGDTPELQEKYRDFNFSQLSEMLQLTDREREIFEPEDKREAIRDYKAFQKENEADPSRLLTWMEEPKDNFGITVKEFFRTKKDLMNELYASSAYKEQNMEEMADIINPSGSLTFRHKTVFFAMHGYEKGISVTEFGQDPQTVSWKEFFDKMAEVLGDHGKNAWEEVFGVETKETEEPQQEKEHEEEQIPGQDSILNHPEYMPAVEETGPEETERAVNETEQETQNGEDNAPDEKPDPAAGQEPPEPAAAAEKTEDTGGAEEPGQAAEPETTPESPKETAQKTEFAPAQENTAEQGSEETEDVPEENGRQTHQIRLSSEYYDDVISGRKSFELRKNDRGYEEGHILEMMEFRDGRNTGRTIRAEVVYILKDCAGLQDGYCILGIRVLSYY